MNTEQVHRALALALGLLLLFHGIDKAMNGIGHIESMLGNYDLTAKYKEYLAYGVYIGEIVAPVMLIASKYIRIAAAIVAVNMLVAIFLKSSDKIFTLGEHGGWSIELPFLYLLLASILALWKYPSK
jgi:putative oxidoreductase